MSNVTRQYGYSMAVTSRPVILFFVVFPKTLFSALYSLLFVMYTNPLSILINAFRKIVKYMLT